MKEFTGLIMVQPGYSHHGSSPIAGRIFFGSPPVRFGGAMGRAWPLMLLQGRFFVTISQHSSPVAASKGFYVPGEF